MKKIAYELARLLLILAVLPGMVAAHGAGTIRGVVTTPGPDGEPVRLPGVEILLRCQRAVDNINATVTDESGHFWLSGLEPDKCAITAAVPSFRTETKTVEVTENSVVEVSFQVSLATVAERIAASGNASASKPPKHRPKKRAKAVL
ncbi:MAG: carboxypeptidase regulatory-like domain-containing protein [Acidobacteria bacterium]|nr:carboxypeptidase regulatory-like domain-containing protein [Acidobacteriota bacterium]